MDKKLLLSVGLAFLSVFTFQYFWSKNDQPVVQDGVVSVTQVPVVSGGTVKVISARELYKPLNFDVDFLEKKIAVGAEQVVEIETEHVDADFSTLGAVLKTLDFKEHEGKSKKPLRTIYDQGGYEDAQRKKGSFLLALEDHTPYVYKVVAQGNREGRELVTFETETEQWVIRKTYAFYADSYKMDLTLDFEPKVENAKMLKPRLFFAAPFVHELDDDAITPFMFNEHTGALDKGDAAKLRDMVWYWTTPKVIFGAEDRYFIHALIDDSTKFAQRAYFKKLDNTSIYALLEGPEVTEKNSWTMSFYMGPKVFDHLSYVDERLSDILSFGWLSWFCKIMLKLLDFIYKYVGNYGFAIIILTILLRVPFVPLSIYSRRRMAEYQRHQPHIARIRLKYKADMNMQQAEVMQYHRDHNLSAATPVIGCLPMLIQIPILFSLYRVLGSYLDLYQAPFFGWIFDLSAKDPLYVLPILMGISMIWMHYTTPKAPGDDGKQKVIMIFMSLVMTVVFAGFPAGLVLYWFMNNMLTIGEDYLRKALFSN